MPDQQIHTPTGTTAALAAKSVPEHRHAIWYYFGGLALFLLIVMIGSGLLLSVYYEPSAAPAVAVDGTPLAAARVLKGITVGERIYREGEIIALPFDAATEEVIAPGPLEGRIEMLIDPVTRRPIRPSAAWVSVEGRIMHDVEFGPLVRSVHAYAANALIATVIIHMFSAFFMRAYRRPRRMMWVTGVVLLLLVLGFGFTGYLLPWNRLAYFATRVGVSLPESSLPGIGEALAGLLRGGDDVAGATLTRMYSAHVVALPLATLAFVALHILLLQVFGLRSQSAARRKGGMMMAAILAGISLATMTIAAVVSGSFDPASPLILVPLTILPVAGAYLLSGLAMTMLPEGSASRDAAPSIPFYSSYIYRDLLCWLLAFGIVVTLAIARPWSQAGELGMPVDLTKPIVTPKGIHPEWYFMAAFQLLRALPGTIAMLLMIVVGVVWFAIPWLDRGADEQRRRTWVAALGIALLLALVGLTVWGYV